MTRVLLPLTAALLTLPLHAAEPTLTGPYTHGNLSIFLLHGKDTIPAGTKLLTLQEAMEQKKLIVHETSEVNKLAVENVSDDAEVFIQSGDIVKGGRQDRLLARDMIVPPKSGKLPIASFCVEQGRWARRGAESAGQFSASNAQAGNKDVKLAANAAMNQREVWDKIKEAQMKLARNVGKPVANQQSPSSYQLTLEDKELMAKIDAYVKELKKIPESKPDAVGFVIVINGKVEGAELYGSHALFLKLWPKLIHGAAIDALAERKESAKFGLPNLADVKKFLAEGSQGTEKELPAISLGSGRGQQVPAANKRPTNPPAQSSGTQPDAPAVATRLRNISIDNPTAIMLEAKDRKDGRVIHRSYIAK